MAKRRDRPARAVTLRSFAVTWQRAFARPTLHPYLRGVTPRADMKHEQLALFESQALPVEPPAMPAGFRYAPDVIDADEETRLVAAFADLPFKEFEFHGFLGKRRVVSFGSRYDFNGGGLQEAAPIPPFLLPLRERAAAFAGLAPDRLVHALITEYRPGTAIGWHRDRPHYDDVIGVSLLSPCTFRMREETRRRLGARLAAARPPLDLSDARPVARRLGAQHPRGGGASVFGDVSVDAGALVRRLPTK